MSESEWGGQKGFNQAEESHAEWKERGTEREEEKKAPRRHSDQTSAR